jgi:hypothetical protein
MTSLNLPDVAKPPSDSNPISRWDGFLGEIAAGAKLAEAMAKHYVCRADIETMCRLDDGGVQKQRWNDARLAGMKSAWTVFEMEDFFNKIASGLLVDEAVMAVKGRPAVDTDIYRLLSADADMRARYKEAKEAHALIVGEGMFSIADDKSGDVLETPKGPTPNMANVTRDKLRIDTRWRYASAYNSKLFGEKKDTMNVQVNINHAERLESARERAKVQDRRITPRQLANAVDAVFSEKTAVTADDDTTWMDDKPEDKK